MKTPRNEKSTQTDQPEFSPARSILSGAHQEEALPTPVETVITWPHSGLHVFVKGSWDNWKNSVALMPSPENKFKTKQTLFALLSLLPGTYTYKFIVDGVWLCDSRKPQAEDAEANVNNVLTVEDEECQVNEQVDAELLATKKLNWVPKGEFKSLKGHSISVIGGEMLVFGGKRKTEHKADLWCINTQTMEWSMLFVEGASPEARAHHK